MNPALYRIGIPTLGGAVVGGAGAAQDGGDFGNVLGGALLGAGMGAGGAGLIRSFDTPGPAAERIAKKVSKVGKGGRQSSQDFLNRQIAQLLDQTPDSEIRKAALIQAGRGSKAAFNPLIATSAGDVSGLGSTALGYGAMLPAGAIAGGVASMLSPIDPESYGSSNLPQTRANSLYQMTSNLNR